MYHKSTQILCFIKLIHENAKCDPWGMKKRDWGKDYLEDKHHKEVGLYSRLDVIRGLCEGVGGISRDDGETVGLAHG